MTERRSRRARKKGKALGKFISVHLEDLRYLARELNGEAGSDERGLVDTAAAVIDATLGAPYPRVPDAAAKQFNDLADSAPLNYVVGMQRPKDKNQFFVTMGSIYVYLRTLTVQGVWATKLARFLVNPQRDRLRRCQTCRRWFMDETRNKSGRRCSRKCTIAWSNAQRTMKTTTKRKRGSR